MPTQSVTLFAEGHAAALAERGELALGNPRPKFGGVQVDAVLSEVEESQTEQVGGVYKKGDFRAVAAKDAFPAQPTKGTECQVRGQRWKINDPIREGVATYQFAITRTLRG